MSTAMMTKKSVALDCTPFADNLYGVNDGRGRTKKDARNRNVNLPAIGSDVGDTPALPKVIIHAVEPNLRDGGIVHETGAEDFPQPARLAV